MEARHWLRSEWPNGDIRTGGHSSSQPQHPDSPRHASEFTEFKLDDVNGDGAVTYLPSNGTKITTTGSRTISPSTVGVSTTGTPQYDAPFAD
ncbi:hypothetical protein OG223_28530 [Streptomyces sp. NBC_01478]|uniref:hypothetical protein n=1 Tax=Streptomyces sp. NBC_01478 TaxID=2903882 RepID=UPI002E317BBF|nr:hypothetical protein [Streptomyces sp. NBC_01478]